MNKNNKALEVKISDEADGTFTLKIQKFTSQSQLVDFLDKLNNIIYSSPFGFKLGRADEMNEMEQKVVEFLKAINR